MSTPTWLTAYLNRGFRLVFFPTRTKGPNTPGWTTKIYTPADYTDGDNVGVMTGAEIQPGRFLVDIDFDWPEGLPMAKRILPPTEFGFGRSSRFLSHAFYTTDTPLPTYSFDDINGHPFVEFRGTKTDGSLGHETVLPPSIHPSGEPIEFRVDGTIGHASDLFRRTQMYAVGCILVQHLGHRGLLHDTRLYVAAFLLSLGLTEDEVITIGEAVADATGNDVNDVSVTVSSTIARVKRGERVAGSGPLIKMLGEEGKRVLARIREWLGETEFVLGPKEQIAPNNQENIQKAFDKLGVELSYDEFTGKPKVVFNGVESTLEDSIRNRLWLTIDKTFAFRPSPDFFDVVMMDTARNNPIHPVRTYLEGLTWDGVPRLDSWLHTYGSAADTDYTKAVGSITLIAAVRRVFNPGAKFDELLVLESTQGLMKSTALRTLCPDQSWFSDDLPLDVDAKQLIERTQGKWIIEAAELSGMRATLMEHLKALLSRQVDGPVHLAYARLPVEVPRQFIVIGTTNSHMYLSDSTGNRRFWPVRVGQFHIDRLRQDRDQLWAEAVSRHREGASIRLPEHLYTVAARQQERRRIDDPWEAKIIASFPTDNERVAPDQLWEVLSIPTERRSPEGQKRINAIMQQLGFRRMSVKGPDGKVVKGWGRGNGQRDPYIIGLGTPPPPDLEM